MVFEGDVPNNQDPLINILSSISKGMFLSSGFVECRSGFGIIIRRNISCSSADMLLLLSGHSYLLNPCIALRDYRSPQDIVMPLQLILASKVICER
jgi:hypothetical protein